MKSYKTLFNWWWMWSGLCPICNVTACDLMEESAIMGRPSHDSIICASHLKYQMKKYWFEASLLYEQLLSSSHAQHFVPYAKVWLWSSYTERSINYFDQKFTFFFKFKSFQPLKLFLEILVYQPTWFKIQVCLST